MSNSTKYLLLFCCCSISCVPSPEQAEANSGIVANNAEDVVIEYIAHASFLLKYNDYTLLLDPFADTTWISYFFPRDIEADAIFSTHPHYDHDGGIFRHLDPYWQGKIPFYQEPGEYTIGDFKMTGIKGKHSEPYGKEFGQRNTIFLYDVAGIRFCHWGDNGPVNDTIAPFLTNIDVLMLPIDDTYHILKADEVAAIIAHIKPRIIIPMHYRIAELEPTPGKPKNLGPVDEYIDARDNVNKLKGNTYTINKEKLPEKEQYILFRHSAKVKSM